MTKFVNFEKIIIENFLSIGKEPVEIDLRPGLHIITGSNKDQSDRRNGIGKSTILDGLCFVLFGSTLRELKKEFIINNITKKTPKVSLFFNIQENNITKRYELYRTIEPSKCFLYEDGIDITRDSMVNTTEYVQNILKLSPEVFQNCIAMTLNNTVPFMAKKKVEKRKFIESIFNLEVFSNMNSNLKQEMQEMKKDFDIKNAKFDEIKKHYNNLVEQSSNKEKEKKRRKETLHERKESTVNDLEQTKKLIGNIQDLDITEIQNKIKYASDKQEELSAKINKTGKDITSIETKRDYVKTSLTKIGTDKDICPVCLKTVTELDKNHIVEKKKILKDEIKEYNDSIAELESKLSLYEESKIKLDSALSKLKEIVNRQKLQAQQKVHLIQKEKDLLVYIETIDKDIEDLEKTNNDLTSAIDVLKEKVDNVDMQIKKDKHNLNILDLVKFVLGEDGVRSYIVKKILALFNNKLSGYLRKLNSNAFIKFDEYFEETIVNNKGVEMSYFNFSGAEKKVIDLAIMFTFIEMLRLQSNISYNVQFYDELLDTSLDEAGVEMVVNLLTELVQTKNYGIYVISHRKECSKLSTGDVIFLEKQEGITKRIQYSE
jgi:DNA repair exonuclease SbcCD ATPase subunit